MNEKYFIELFQMLTPRTVGMIMGDLVLLDAKEETPFKPAALALAEMVKTFWSDDEYQEYTSGLQKGVQNG